MGFLLSLDIERIGGPGSNLRQLRGQRCCHAGTTHLKASHLEPVRRLRGSLGLDLWIVEMNMIQKGYGIIPPLPEMTLNRPDIQ